MCYNAVKIESCSSYGARYGFVPCGKCEECRSANRAAWAFRLCAEVESVKDEGWKVGFCTLTYNPENLPYLDSKFFVPGSKTALSDIPCFNKDHVRSFIHALRNWLFKEYHNTAIKYMIVSEYGKRGRPHYHLLMCWHPVGYKRVKDESTGKYVRIGRKFKRVKCELTAESIHSWIKSNWNYGYVLPERPEGGMRRGLDGKLRRLSPFEVVDAGLMASRYASKYVCKDLAFPDFLDNKDFIKDMDEDTVKELRNCSPFHMQSQSLGLSLLKHSTPEQKIALVVNGYQFKTEFEFKQIPVYLKNKIFFSPKYCIAEDGKRLVRRERTEFFTRYYQEIFDKRAQFYAELCRSCMTEDFWIQRKVSEESAKHFTSVIRENFDSLKCSFLYLSQLYLAYYGVNRAMCYDVDPVVQWYARYSSVYNDEGEDIGNLVDFEGVPYLDESRGYEFYDRIQLFWTGLFRCLSRTNGFKVHDFDFDDVYDFYNPKQLEMMYATA